MLDFYSATTVAQGARKALQPAGEARCKMAAE